MIDNRFRRRRTMHMGWAAASLAVALTTLPVMVWFLFELLSAPARAAAHGTKDLTVPSMWWLAVGVGGLAVEAAFLLYARYDPPGPPLLSRRTRGPVGQPDIENLP